MKLYKYSKRYKIIKNLFKKFYKNLLNLHSIGRGARHGLHQSRPAREVPVLLLPALRPRTVLRGSQLQVLPQDPYLRRVPVNRPVQGRIRKGQVLHSQGGHDRSGLLLKGNPFHLHNRLHHPDRGQRQSTDLRSTVETFQPVGQRRRHQLHH